MTRIKGVHGPRFVDVVDRLSGSKLKRLLLRVRPLHGL